MNLRGDHGEASAWNWSSTAQLRKELYYLRNPKKLLSILSVEDLVCQTIHLWVVQSSCSDMATNMLQVFIGSKFKTSCSGISPPSEFYESFELKSF